MLQKILSRMRKAIEDYQMIEDGDHVAVGVSGGKDSLILLTGLVALQRFLPVRFKVTAITLSLGFEGFNRAALVAFYEQLGVDWHIEDTKIGEVVFETRKETNPCALCANMKRGTLHSTAKRLGCNKIAFGHHMDDAIETLMMSLIYEGRLHCFSPVTHLDRTDIVLIRPMIYAEEKMIRACCRSEGIVPIPSGCPVDGGTKRETIKRHIVSLKAENPNIRAALFGAIQRGQLNGWKPMGKSSQFKKGHPEEIPSIAPAPESPVPESAMHPRVSHEEPVSASIRPERIYRALAEQLPMAAVIIRERDDALLYMNRIAEEDFQTNLSQARHLPTGAGFASLDDIARLRHQLKETGNIRSTEIRLNGVDDHRFWSLISAVRINLGDAAEDDAAFLICISRIDALKEMEEKLKRSHARQTLILGMLLQLYHPADLGQSYTNILGLTGRYFDIDRASLFSYRHDGSLRLRQEWKTLKRKPSADSTVRLADHRSRLLGQLGTFMRSRSRYHTGLEEPNGEAPSMLDVPAIPHPWFAQVIRINDQPVALLLLEDYRQAHEWTEDDGTTLDSVGFILTMAHERRKTEMQFQAASRKAQETNLTKSRFLANMSHELRTPLNAILGFMDLLGTSVVTKEQQEYIQEAKTATDMLLYLINDVLDYSKIEAGHLSLETIRFDLRACVENTILLHAPKAREKGIQLGVHIDPALPATLLGDPIRIGQILANLVSNAVKFTHEGNILVEVLPASVLPGMESWRQSQPAGWRAASAQGTPDLSDVDEDRSEADDATDSPPPPRIAVLHSIAGDVFPHLAYDGIPGQMQLPVPTAQASRLESVPGKEIGLVFRISDSGIGMSRAVLDRLFHPFTQADGTISRQYGGTGLGLAITHRLVEMMHGWIAVESREGKGSSFTCHVPLLQPVDEETAATEAIRMPDGQGARVLIASGNRMPVRILSRYLDAAGYVPVAVDSAADAINRMSEASHWNAVFLADDLPDSPFPMLLNILLQLPSCADVPFFSLAPMVQGGKEADPRFRSNLHLPLRYRDVVAAMRMLSEAPTLPPAAANEPVRLRRKEAAKPAPDTSVADEKGARALPAILLAEDNPTNRIVFVNMLKVYGLTCDESPDGMDAVQACERRHYDIVFMDCQMPVLDGFAATRLIRRSAVNRTARIIALTAHTLAADRTKCIEAGMDAHIGKPVTMDILFAHLDETLRELGFPPPERLSRNAARLGRIASDTSSTEPASATPGAPAPVKAKGIVFPKPDTYDAKPFTGADLATGGTGMPLPQEPPAHHAGNPTSGTTAEVAAGNQVDPPACTEDVSPSGTATDTPASPDRAADGLPGSRWPTEHPVQVPISALMRELGFTRLEAEDLIALFLRELGETMERAANRTGTESADEFTRLFHRHKGAAGSLQLTCFHKLMETLELAERAGDATIRFITSEEVLRNLTEYQPLR